MPTLYMPGPLHDWWIGSLGNWLFFWSLILEAHSATGLLNSRDQGINFIMALNPISIMAHLTFGSFQIAFETFWLCDVTPDMWGWQWEGLGNPCSKPWVINIYRSNQIHYLISSAFHLSNWNSSVPVTKIYFAERIMQRGSIWGLYILEASGVTRTHHW